MYRFQRTYNVTVPEDEARRLLAKWYRDENVGEAKAREVESGKMCLVDVVDELVYIHCEVSPVQAECGCCPAVTIVSCNVAEINQLDLF